MMRMIMRSGTAVNILMQKRVRFICVRDTIVLQLDDLSQEILLQVAIMIR